MSQAVLKALQSKFGDAILASASEHTDESVTVAADKLIEVCTFLRDDDKMNFDSPVFLSCIDLLGLHRGASGRGASGRGASGRGASGREVSGRGASGREVSDHDSPRFELVVQLRSFAKKHRIRVKVPLQESKLKVPSLSGLWPGFNWLERETFDMYGVEFESHPDMRRIYLYDEFVGHPLRKDFPKDRHTPLARREWEDE